MLRSMPRPGRWGTSMWPSTTSTPPMTISFSQGSLNSSKISWIRKLGSEAFRCAQAAEQTGPCAHLNASLPNFLIHEIFDEFNEPWEKEIVIGGVEVVDGYIEVPLRPGLGIDLNIEEILKHPYRRENAIPLFRKGWEKRQYGPAAAE